MAKKTAEELKSDRIKKLMDTTAKKLEAEGVEYFIGVVDKEAPDGGHVYEQSDLKGDSFCYLLEIALPTRADRVNLGIWVGRLLTGKKK